MDHVSLDDPVQLERQIERCRRIKSWMTDDEVRYALEQLAREYESRLPWRRSRGGGFMLQPRGGRR